MNTNEVAISINDVSKDFILPHADANSVKSLLTGFHRKNIGKSGDEIQHALRDINFDIKKGEFFGIVGRNGSGKSTLLKILAGIYQATSGSVETHGKLVPFIELGVGFNPELTGRENVYLNGAMLGFSEKQIDAMYDDIVEFAELKRFMDQKLKNYSSGMQVRLAFSMATRAKADILLVDEVLAVGDADFQRKCFKFFKQLKKQKKTVVFVSHDMNAVREYCDRAVLIEDSNLKMIGNTEEVAQEYSKLFLSSDATSGRDAGATRWGGGAIKYSSVKVSQKDDKISIDLAVTAHSAVETALYGLHIFSESGQELMATNNRLIKQPDINNLAPGESLDISWDVLNIFNDGTYTITVTLADPGGFEHDWYNEAGSFTVKRPERSTTPILPPMKIRMGKVSK